MRFVRFVHRSIRRFRHVLRGCADGCVHDPSIQTAVFLGGAFVGVFAFLLWPLREVELIMLVLAWTLVLITEFQNSSVESALDALHPDIDERVRRSKDLASASAFIAGLFSLAVVTWILWTHFGEQVF